MAAQTITSEHDITVESLIPTLPWDLFTIAEQNGESFGRFVQLVNVLIPAGATLRLAIPIPRNEAWWLVNMEWSRILPNEVMYTILMDGANRLGQTNIVLTQSFIGIALCPPTGGTFISNSYGAELVNLTGHPVILDGTCFIRVVSRRLAERWQEQFGTMLDRLGALTRLAGV